MRLQYAVGDTLRTMRKDRDLSLRDLALLTYVSASHLSEVERGIKQASNDMLECIAKGLNVTSAELFKAISLNLEEERL